MKKRVVSAFLLFVTVFTFSLSGCEKPDGKVTVDPEINALYELKSMRGVPKTISNATPLFWEVEGKDGGTAYLFGSYHVADKSYLSLSDEIMRAYLDSDALAVELDIVKISEGEDLAMQMALAALDMNGYEPPTVAAYKYYVECLNLLENYPEFLGGMASLTRNFKPGFVIQLIQNIAVEKVGFVSDYGADTLFLNVSKELGKEILEIEELETQIDLLYSMSPEYEEIMLENFAIVSKQAPSAAAFMKLLTDDLKNSYLKWKRGDLEYFEAGLEPDYDELYEYFRDFSRFELFDIDVDASKTAYWDDYAQARVDAYRDYEKKMNDDRNVVMTDAVESYLAEDKTVFVIVGLAHMVGEKGIVNALRQAGHTVTLKSGDGTGAEFAA